MTRVADPVLSVDPPSPGGARRLILGRTAGGGRTLRVDGPYARRLRGLAEDTMVDYLPVLEVTSNTVMKAVAGSPLDVEQGFAPARLASLALRGWLIDVAVGAAALGSGTVEAPEGNLVLELGPELDDLAPLAFGLNLSVSEPEDGQTQVVAGRLWIGWPPGRVWWIPPDVLRPLGRWPDGWGARSDAEAEWRVKARFLGLLGRSGGGPRPSGQDSPRDEARSAQEGPPWRQLVVPLLDASCSESQPLSRALAAGGRALFEKAIEPCLASLPRGPERIAVLRLILEVAGAQGVHAGLLPAPQPDDVVRWIWLGPLPSGAEKWLGHGL
jgi:hypothetical protein